MEEEVEIFELDEMRVDQSETQIMKRLQQRLDAGFKVSIMVRKIFKMPIPSTKKNNLFSKHPDIFAKTVYNISDSFESIEQNDNIQFSPKPLRRADNTASSFQNNEEIISAQDPSPQEKSQSIKDIEKEFETEMVNEPTKLPAVDVSVQVTLESEEKSCAQLPPLTLVQPHQLTVPIERMESQRMVSLSMHSITDKYFKGSQRSLNKESSRSFPRPMDKQSTLQEALPLASPSSSSDSGVDFFIVKDDSFWQALKVMPQYQQIQSALLYLQDGHFADAGRHMLQAYQQSLETLQKGTLDKTQYKLYSHISVQALCYYGQVLRHQGNFDEAVRLFERCLKQFEINDIDLLGKIYLECGMNSIQSLKLLKGLDFYHKALAAYEKVNWKLDIAKVLNSIAQVYGLLGAHEDAKKMCYEALAIYKSRLVDSDIRISETYHALGYIFYQQKDYECAMDYLKQSLENKQKLYGDRHLSLVKTYNLMGVIQHTIEEPTHAIEYYEQAVWIYGGETQLGLGQVLNNLGLAYIDRMKLKSARLSFEKAAEIMLEFYDSQHPAVKRVAQNKLLVQNPSFK